MPYSPSPFPLPPFWLRSKTNQQSVCACGDWAWIMNPNEASRLAHAINDLRPDWPISSLRTFIERTLANRAYRDAAVALAWVATDRKIDGTPASDTPKRVLEAGPWWRAAGIEDQTINRPHPPTRSEQCRRCGGRLPSCACTREHMADDKRDDEPAARTGTPGDASLARALLAESKGALCGCGVRIDTCPTHRAELGHVGHTIEEKS